MGQNVSSILPIAKNAAQDVASVADSVQSLVTSTLTNKKSATQVSSILSDIDSFSKSDEYSQCEALRREDGSLRIFITGEDWDRDTIAADLADPDAEDEVVISASRKFDASKNPFIAIEFKRFRDIETDLYEDDPETSIKKSGDDVIEKQTINISAKGKVKTSFPADRKYEVLNGIDALKSTVRRLLELEMYKERGILDNEEDAESVLRQLHVYDNLDTSDISEKYSEEECKDMERQLDDISKILQMVE